MKGGRDKLRFFRYSAYFDVLWTTKERTGSSIMETMCVSKIHNYLKCHRNITEQTNPLQVDNVITNKSLLIYEVSRRIMNTQCVRISVLVSVKTL
jgi:hypothetical protein